MKSSVLFFPLILATAILAQSPGNMPNVMNQLNIETIGKKLKDVIGADIQKNRKLLQELLDLHHNETAQIYKYIDESIEKLSKETFLTMSEFKNNTEDNLHNMDNTMKQNLQNINAKVESNDEKILESIIGTNGSVLSLTEEWMKKRSDAIENIVSSRLSICGHNRHHITPGVVAYDNILQSNTKEIRVLGQTMEWEEVFDLNSGEFTVPEGGAGEYLLSAAVVMDVHSYQAKLNRDRTVMSHYRFLLNGHKELETSSLYSDAGKDSEADLVQASRSIVWHLMEGDSLALKKMDTTHKLSPDAALDHRITFCVTLLHLDESLSQVMAAPPTKKSVNLEEWKYEATPAIHSSTISAPAPPTHPVIVLPSLLPSTKVSEDCSLSEQCTKPPVLTSKPQVFTDNIL
eukprot:GFUD01086081.1.p1 GENE.GFUD01086081.1~~GFUD01086081.1.p1  ORF type:complete len:403 (-),score=128.86 GFUD01086081.1:21-1229(-)